jgi:membrane protein involved in colicin uptake
LAAILEYLFVIIVVMIVAGSVLTGLHLQSRSRQRPQQQQVQVLSERVEELERQRADQEERIRALEAIVTSDGYRVRKQFESELG